MSSYLHQIRCVKIIRESDLKKLRFLWHLQWLLAHPELKHPAKDGESPKPNYKKEADKYYKKQKKLVKK